MQSIRQNEFVKSAGARNGIRQFMPPVLQGRHGQGTLPGAVGSSQREPHLGTLRRPQSKANTIRLRFSTERHSMPVRLMRLAHPPFFSTRPALTSHFQLERLSEFAVGASGRFGTGR